jgi:hypothetical protein
MEHTNAEVAQIQEIVQEANDAKLRELAELQLAYSFSGGGMADTIAF